MTVNTPGKSTEMRKLTLLNTKKKKTVLHAVLSSEDVVVVAADTYVLILMIYAYSKYMIKRRWVFRCEEDKCSDTKTISAYLGI